MSRAEAGPAEDVLVVCAGTRFGRPASDVVDRLTRARSHDHYRFVMDEWMQDDGAEARLLWVVDDDVPLAGLIPWVARQVPLLVPESHHELKNFCLAGQCGLYYAGPDDAEACLHLLLADDPLRRALGENGRAYVALCELMG